MDFHSLTRKELQTLCKNNKIPANMTNVAMADALKALEIVEGLDELMNQSQSPGKTTKNLSQEIPSSVTRTSTRRKPTKEEPQSTQQTIRTRRITRKAIELDEENKNVNVPETPAVVTTTRRRAQKTEPEVAEQKKGDLPETPALRSGRRRAGVGSTMKKVEAQKEEETMQCGNGTRRSVRLLEKCIAGLSLKESGKMEPLKNAQSGTTSEVPLARNLSASLEDEEDLKDDILESSKGYQNGNYDSTIISETVSDQSDNLADISDGTKDSKGSDGAVTEDLSDTHNTDEESVPAEVVETKPDVVAEAVKEVSENVLDQASSAKFIKSIEVVGGEYDQAPQDEEFAEDKVSQDVPVFPGSSENLVNEKSEVDSDQTVDSDDSDQTVDSDFDDDSGSDNNSLADELPCETAYNYENLITSMVNNEASVDVNLVMQDSHENDLAKLPEDEENYDQLVDSDIDDDSGSDNNSFVDELPEELPCETAAYCSENLMADMKNEAALVDVNVFEVETIHVVETSLPKATQSVVGEISADKTPDYADAETLFDASVKPAEEFAETTLQEIPPQEKSPTAAKQASPSPYLVSGIAVTSSILFSPQLTAQNLTPARLTPMKSSSKKQTTIPKMTPFSDNKENVENNSVREVEPGQAKMKKNKNVIDDQTMQNLDNMSLRYLKKLTRKLNNLQISDDVMNKEDNNDTEQPHGKVRPALQILPRNCMHAGETEKKN